jgi:hypothetical protein
LKKKETGEAYPFNAENDVQHEYTYNRRRERKRISAASVY